MRMEDASRMGKRKEERQPINQGGGGGRTEAPVAFDRAAPPRLASIWLRIYSRVASRAVGAAVVKRMSAHMAKEGVFCGNLKSGQGKAVGEKGMDVDPKFSAAHLPADDGHAHRMQAEAPEGAGDVQVLVGQAEALHIVEEVHGLIDRHGCSTRRRGRAVADIWKYLLTLPRFFRRLGFIC